MNLVQPIAVLKTGSHEDTISCAARASLQAYFSSLIPSDTFTEWLSGSFTKTVRRCSEADLNKLQAWANEENAGYTLCRKGASAALALTPMMYDDFPKILSKMQVHGTNFASALTENVTEDDRPLVNVFYLDTLTTGKAAAQVAHAVWKCYLENPAALAWQKSRYALHVTPVTSIRLAQLAQDNFYTIYDNGLTEVETNTLTAVSALNH